MPLASDCMCPVDEKWHRGRPHTPCTAACQIVDSVESLLKNVQQMLHKVEQRVKDAAASRDGTQQRYDKLMEKQRKYYQLVKDYQAECQRNEEVIAR